MPRRSQTRRFPIPKNQERGLLRVRFSRVRRAASCRAQAAHILLQDRAPPAPALFVCSHFCHFPVHSCLRDMPRRSQTRRFPIPKNQERGPLRVRFSRVRRAASCRGQAAHIPLWDGAPPAPALFVCGYFAISRSAAACASCPGAAKQGAFPSPKAKNAGCQCFVFLQTRRPIAACATWGRRSRLHLLGVCGMINTAQALGPRKGRGGAPCRDRRGRYGT
mgnify:CR=1 FL=1